MDDDDNSISTSPTPIRTRRSIRVRRKEAHSVEIKEDREQSTRVQEQSSINEVLASREDLLFEIDRLDCLRAQQEPARIRAVPASKNFMSLQSMLESQQFPEDEADAVVWHSPEITLDESSQPKTIAEEILFDFCGSPSYVEEDEEPTYDFTPWFRFRNKIIRTYNRNRLAQPNSPNILTEDDDDERMSCSSGLSVQDDLITQMPKTTHCNFDANNSQNLYENLQNLSAFFTQNNAKSSIDLPANVPKTSDDIEGMENVTDILVDNGYLFGNTEECRLQEEICDTRIMERAESTLFNESTRPQTDDKEIYKIEPHDTNVCDDWFDGDMNTELIPLAQTTEKLKRNENEKIDTNEISELELLDEIPLSEWQPIDIPNSTLSEIKCETNVRLDTMNESAISTVGSVEFHTASNKHIEISNENRKQAAQLMADLDANYSTKEKEPSDDVNKMEFRTASNKTMKLTEEMKKKAAMLMADLEIGPANQLEAEDQSNQVMEFRTAANKTIKLTEQMKVAGANLMADLEMNRTKEEEFLDEIPLSEWQPIDIESVPQQQLDTVEPFGFHTASNRAIEVTEEHKQQAARLMADLEINYSQTAKESIERIYHPPEISENIQFRTASNRPVELSEEMQKKAAMLMADLEPISVPQEAPREDCQESLLETVAKTNEDTEEVQNTAVKIEMSVQLKENEKGTDILVKPSEARKRSTVSTLTATPNEDAAATTSSPTSPFKAIDTPRSTPDMQVSLTQLSERSPLDKITKSSIITRRNLLSLNKRRKLKRDSENSNVDNAGQTPIRQRFAPVTSTPVPTKSNQKQQAGSQRIQRDRSCSMESPSVQRQCVGKRRSEEALSPIYAPTHKTRRLGLSRIRNKSSNEI